MVMAKKIGILVVIAIGLLWGLSEIFLGDVFYRFQIPMRAALLTSVGLTLLVIGRLVFDRPGTSLAASIIAGALRCLVPKLYICHMIAIALEGCVFDVSWTALRAGETRSLRRAWLSTAIAAYVGFLSFGFVGAYGFKFGRWVVAGPGGIAAWALKSGTVSTAVLIGLVPIAAVAARRLIRAPSPSRNTTHL
jgi:hypothetical protein